MYPEFSNACSVDSQCPSGLICREFYSALDNKQYGAEKNKNRIWQRGVGCFDVSFLESTTSGTYYHLENAAYRNSKGNLLKYEFDTPSLLAYKISPSEELLQQDSGFPTQI